VAGLHVNYGCLVMRFEELLEKLIETLSEINYLGCRLNECEYDRKANIGKYKKQRADVGKLLIRKCDGKPDSFSIFDTRIQEYFDQFDEYLNQLANDKLRWELQGVADLIIDNLGEVSSCIGADEDDYAAAAEHIQSFKDEQEFIQAGANALQRESERKSGHRLDRTNRTLYWFGEMYEAIERNPFEIVAVLYDAFIKGMGWVSLEYIRTECPEIATIQGSDEKSIGISEVFTLRVPAEGSNKRTRQKLKIWEIIQVDGRKSPRYRLKIPSNQIPE